MLGLGELLDPSEKTFVDLLLKEEGGEDVKEEGVES